MVVNYGGMISGVADSACKPDRRPKTSKHGDPLQVTTKSRYLEPSVSGSDIRISQLRDGQKGGENALIFQCLAKARYGIRRAAV
jgi:hypothetical protein